MNRIKLTPHLSVEALEQRYRRTPEPTERSRWQIIWLLSKGLLAREVAASTGYSAYWIGQLARRYNAEGPAGMVNRRHTTSHRAAPLLTSAQVEELRQALGEPAPDGDRWTSGLVAAWMAERLGRPVATQRGWDYLQRLGARLRQPRPRHVAASAAEQAAFKKRSGG
jgi:transposase